MSKERKIRSSIIVHSHAERGRFRSLTGGWLPRESVLQQLELDLIQNNTDVFPHHQINFDVVDSEGFNN